MGKRWIYHRAEQPKIINNDKFDAYYDDGWRDSPAPFLTHEDFGVSDGDDVGAQNAADAVQGVVDSLNGALNLDEMTKDELIEHAAEHFGANINKSTSKVKILSAIQGLIDGNSKLHSH